MNKSSPRPSFDPFAALASLKLTVALLGMAIFIVFAGTVAQIDQGIYSVEHGFFRTGIAQIQLKIFFPRDWNVPGEFPFPGGWLIGGVLIVNLLVAHARRIRVKAQGVRLLAGAGVMAAGILLTWFVIANVFDEDSSEKTVAPFWRVLLQLIEGGGAAAVLLIGCVMLFKKKAGIVLLHLGVVLMMLSELMTGLFAEEGRMRIYEGETVNFIHDVRSVELAIVDATDPDRTEDTVVVVPGSRLRRGGLIQHADLPFNLHVDPEDYMVNSSLRPAEPGLRRVAVREKTVSGTDTDGRIDVASVYVTFEKSGRHLVSVWLNRPQQIAFEGRIYNVSLRFTRRYLPYSLHLIDFRFDKYVGTMKAKNFSSDVRLVDPGRGVDRDVRIWMNNPLRYAGATFYQAGYDELEERYTDLQVVHNAGWMVPYVACMIVALGMLCQFGIHLLGFLRRRRAA